MKRKCSIMLSLSLLLTSVLLSGCSKTSESSSSYQLNNSIMETSSTTSVETGSDIVQNVTTKKQNSGATITETSESIEISMPEVTPKQDRMLETYGAYGDGIHDDSEAIQKALDEEDTVYFSKDKTYKLINNGLSIRKDVTIIGNGATLLIDDSYAPQNEDFQKRIFRSNMTEKSFLNVRDLNFQIDFSDGRFYDTNYLVVMQPTYIDSVTLTNISINIEKSNNLITNLWFDHGCDSIEISNCSFTNNTTNKEGGIFWLLSNTDETFQKYNDFHNVTVNNCKFTGTCGDEPIALWGPNNISVDFDNLVVDWNRTGEGTSRAINIVSNSGENATYIANFSNSRFTCTSPDTLGCDSMIGTYAKYPSNQIQVTFKNSIFDATVRDSFIHNQFSPKDVENLNGFDFLNPNNNLVFQNCTIRCNQTITGASNFTSGNEVMNPASNCSFQNCNIACSYAFAYLELFSGTSWYYTPTIALTNTDVDITNAKGFLLKSTKAADCSLNLEQTSITMNLEVPLISHISEEDIDNPDYFHMNHSEQATTKITTTTINNAPFQLE